MTITDHIGFSSSLPIRSRRIIVGISGATCGGKSTLAEQLQTTFGDTTKKLCQDDFYFPENDPAHVQVTALNHLNWELVTAVNNARLLKTINKDILVEDSCSKTVGKDGVFKLLEAFKTDSSGAVAKSLLGHTPSLFEKVQCPILFLDGITLFNYKPIYELCDVRLFITLDRETCKVRRSKRSYDPPDPKGYFDQIVWPYYEKNLNQLSDYRQSSINFIDGRNPDSDTLVAAYKLVLEAILVNSD
jgi:nicotinamide/nicotinate riboside kinase